ncbi:MAG: GspE/PulE/PilB domain-containing protein, partial [Acidobacteriaceae bacterium]
KQMSLFDGAWTCSTECLRVAIGKALMREVGDVFSRNEATPHRHRVPLGLVMLAQGWITHPQLQQALDAQKRSGQGRIGDWLMSECGLQAAHVTKALSLQWGCPVLSPNGFDAARMALVMPRQLLQSYDCVPLRLAAGRILYLAFEDGIDASAAYSLVRMTGLRVESGLMESRHYRQLRNQLLAARSTSESLEVVPDLGALTEALVKVAEREQPAEARLVRMRDRYWLRTWLKPGEPQHITPNIPLRPEEVTDRIYQIGRSV